MVRTPGQDERESYLFADIASAADAGLTADQILNGPATASLGGVVHNSASLTEGLCTKGIELAPHEILMLETAEAAGAFSRAMRSLAEQRAQRAGRTRELIRRLAYPVFLLLFATAVSFLIGAVVPGQGMLTPFLWLGGLVVLVGCVALLVRQTLHDPERGLIRPLRELILDVGELPYLRSVHGLYAAGVKLPEAHALALETSPVPGIRKRLTEAGRALAKGTSLTESLHLCQVLHPETRQMLAAAEVAGDLEGAMERAIARRQSAFDQRARWMLVTVASAITGLVFLYVAVVVFRFYLGYYEGLGRLLR